MKFSKVFLAKSVKTQTKKNLEIITSGFVLQSLRNDAKIDRYQRTEIIEWYVNGKICPSEGLTLEMIDEKENLALFHTRYKLDKNKTHKIYLKPNETLIPLSCRSCFQSNTPEARLKENFTYKSVAIPQPMTFLFCLTNQPKKLKEKR